MSPSLGIDLGGTKIEGILLGPDGAERARLRIPSPQGDYAATIAAIVSVVRAIEGDTRAGIVSPGRVGEGDTRATVGIGIPGIVSPATGRVKNANSTWINGHPLDQDLAVALGRPVRVENDANCLAVSEATDGAGAGARVVFAAILGTGCGGGIVVDGQVWRGRNAVAGEWGHTALPWPTPTEYPGPACYCGKHGCMETFVSGTGFAADHHRVTGELLSAAAIVARADAGDLAARASLDRLVDRLARGLAGIVNVLDPDVIVLGGGLSNVPALYEALPARIEAHAFSDRIDTPVRRAVHGDSSGVRGAAWLWRT